MGTSGWDPLIEDKDVRVGEGRSASDCGITPLILVITTATASTTKIAFTMESKIAETNKGRRRSALPTFFMIPVLTQSRKEMPAVPY